MSELGQLINDFPLFGVAVLLLEDQSLQEVIQLLAQLPDRDSQQIKLQLEKLANLPAASAPKLITLGLLGASS